ncbi:hypothetical protein [Micromonospora sp. NPDC005174]|uniref:hypothetical protein n=1 Tax=Micromonospora sp. NPDC005174 TaxID=3157018 RepID=UPI0033B58FF6
MSDTADDYTQPAARQPYDLETDTLAQDCWTNNPPELAVLEGAYFGYRMGDHMTGELLAATNQAFAAGLLRENPHRHGWLVTKPGELRLAELWGVNRVPPGGGGHVSCWVHGTYVVAPGDLWTCPDCPTTDDKSLSQVQADDDPIVAGVLAELRAADIRRIHDGDLTADEAAVLASIYDGAVVRRDGRWVTSVNYTAGLLADAGMAWVQVDPDGVEHLTPTVEGEIALRQQPDQPDVPVVRVWPAWLLWLAGALCVLGAVSGVALWMAR